MKPGRSISVQMLHSEKGENGFVDETVHILIQSLLWLRYHTVYSETLELTMKWTPAKLCNKDRLMPNWMLVNCILPSVIFSSIKTALQWTKPKNTDSKLSNYFRQLLYDVTSLQMIFYAWTLFCGKLYQRGLISLPDSMLMKYILYVCCWNSIQSKRSLHCKIMLLFLLEKQLGLGKLLFQLQTKLSLHV